MIMLNYLSIHLNHNISHLFKTRHLRHYLFILILGYLIIIKVQLSGLYGSIQPYLIVLIFGPWDLVVNDCELIENKMIRLNKLI